MDIILATETCASDLENSSKETDAECLRQKISHILNRNLNIKLRDNLSKPQRKVLVQMKNNKDTTIYPFDKGSGFVVLSEKNAMQKIENWKKKNSRKWSNIEVHQQNPENIMSTKKTKKVYRIFLNIFVRSYTTAIVWYNKSS